MRIPKIVYDSTTLTLSQPQLPWTHWERTIGGAARADSGLAANFIIRHEFLTDVQLRVMEDELAAVQLWLRTVQNAKSFTFWFDKDEALTAVPMLVESPAAGTGERRLSRSQGYLPELTLNLTLRTASGNEVLVPFYRPAA